MLTAECVIWQGAKNNKGYGRKSHKGVPVYVHRLAYEERHDPIPEGLEIDHLCRTPLCYNPDHLEAVTRRENLRRGVGNQYKDKKACKRGHLYSLENTRLYINKKGCQIRVCRECERTKHGRLTRST